MKYQLTIENELAISLVNPGREGFNGTTVFSDQQLCTFCNEKLVEPAISGVYRLNGHVYLPLLHEQCRKGFERQILTKA